VKTHVLSATGLGRSFGERTALAEASLELDPGELMVLIGPNGAGKTTLLEIVAGVAPLGSGRLSVRASIGFCPQGSLHWTDLSPREQLVFLGQLYGLSRSAAGLRAEELLTALGLHTHGDQLAATLSGGMLRRLNLASGLVHRPGLLILDEPTAGLDPESKRLVYELLRAETAGRGTAVLLSTHDFAEAQQLADRVAIMDQGRIVACDSPETLLGRRKSRAMIELDVAGADAGLRDRARAALSGFAPSARSDGDAIVLEVMDVTSALGNVAAALEGVGLSPRAIRSRARSLEDVFVELTGRRLSE
jgi:ABC-2 type transport system ATP-binding protein